MARQIINIGTTANDGTGDGLRTAFDKANDNFAELYGNSVAPTFLTNGTSNIGIADSDGNVSVTVANLSNVAIFSQTSLELTGNLISDGNLSASSLSLTGSVASDLIPTGTGVLNLGSDSNRWGEIYLSGSTITLGDLVLKDDGANRLAVYGPDGITPGTVVSDVINTGSIDASGNIVAGNIEANTNITTSGYFIGDGGFLSNVTVVSNVAVTQIANGSSILSIAGADGNINGTVNGAGTLTITSTGANVAGYITATGNITGDYILGNGSQLAGLPEGYTDADAVALLASFGSNTISTTGAVTTGDITAGTVSATEFVGDIKGSVFADDSVLIVDAINNVIFANVDATSVTATTVSGTLSTAAQTNITSVGTLTSLTMGGNIVMASNNINGLAEPVVGTDAATKTYVDTVAAAGLHYHDPVRVESEVALSADYDNGTSGVGATLTNNSTQAALVIDGITLNTSDRVLIYQQSNAAHNGVYTVTDTGSISTNWVLTRATDADSYGASDPDSLGEGDAFFVQEGAAGAGELYVMTTSGTITFGTTNITFSQINSAQIYSATNGVDLTGVTFSLDSTYSPAFAGLTVPSITHSGTNGVGNIGATGQGFNTVFAKATSAQYADVAEMYATDAEYAPGTVVVFGGSAEVTQSIRDADPMVAGVVSTAPAYLMNNELENAVPLALLGRVPTRVKGPIKRGQMLVSTSDGCARAEENPNMGTVIGKALEDFTGDEGIIEVVIGRL